MFETILVPTDLSENGEKAVEVAVGLAGGRNPVVHVLHVIEPIADTPFEDLEDFYSRLEEQARRRLDELTSPYQREGLVIRNHLVYGPRAQEILRFAEENEVDLIALKSHRIELKPPLQGWGTLSYKVGILAQCPVMLVK
ncbi:MAG: universal stress protein [Desulfatibacillaceae bacterium]